MKLSLSPFGDLLRDSPSLILYYYTMDKFNQYKFTITVKTNHDPREAIFEIVNRLKGILPVLSIEHSLIEDRPTNVEHHGGVTDEQ